LKNEYPQFGGNFVVQHLTEFLSELPIKNLGIESNSDNGYEKLTFHDSCYLGRYNQVYDQPRQLLSQTNLNWVEMNKSGENSFCCGGGGGQMWMETDANTRINHRRLNDVIETGAQVVATACPYCLLMFDDAIRSKGMGDQIQVLDLAEIMANQIDTGVK
jgi:Fe-S oxidoreductase